MLSDYRPTNRTLVLGALALALILSLAFSTSIRYGHSDVPVALSAADIRPLGAGDKAPYFSVETVGNRPFKFDPRKLKRPVVLISFRGGWCPYCNLQLSELRTVIPEISKMGVDVLFLSGDRAERLYDSLKLETQEAIDGLDYTILSDADAQAALALGIAFKTPKRVLDTRRAAPGDEFRGSSMARHGVLPVPAVFAIDTSGMITFAYANPDYRVRLSGDELIAAASKIAPAT
jgi:peroxiredoxin